jgi:hypothetical protein
MTIIAAHHHSYMIKMVPQGMPDRHSCRKIIKQEKFSDGTTP